MLSLFLSNDSDKRSDPYTQHFTNEWDDDTGDDKYLSKVSSTYHSEIVDHPHSDYSIDLANQSS